MAKSTLLLLVAGEEGKPLVFLFTDTQIVKESFLEDINNILNTGEVPNLFDDNELNSITSSMRPIAQAAGLPLTKVALYSIFVKRIRGNMHMCLCTGECRLRAGAVVLRQRL